MKQWDVVVIGAGAAGLMFAGLAGQKGRSVLVVDKGKKPGRKIKISGGGKCNFTNYSVDPSYFLCNNPHFCKSALSRYTQWDFLALIDKYAIAYHEREHGQLFCDNDASDITNMLLAECQQGNVALRYQSEVSELNKTENGYQLLINNDVIHCTNLIIATGGMPMPRLGATDFGLRVAKQFGLNVVEPYPALVPFTLAGKHKTLVQDLAGISFPASIRTNGSPEFKEAMLFTHKGISGPCVLQVSSYWKKGLPININLLPELDSEALLNDEQLRDKHLKTVLAQHLPKRFVEHWMALLKFENLPLKQISHVKRATIAGALNNWQLWPNGTEGYATAEVMGGGVDTNELSSKTMECRNHTGLYFIGEVMDVTGHLGGYNFSWCWASAYAAAQAV